MLKRLRFNGLLIIVLWAHGVPTKAQPSPFDKRRPIEEVFAPVPFGSVMPKGWLREQVEGNIDGFIGELDKLVPDLIVDDDIYGTDRLSKNIRSKDVGALGDEGEWQVQFLWWNSETQSNWRDGYIRSAILAENKTHLKKAEEYVEYILSTQDEDGYLGIYDQELRYNFDNENGELWAKATLLRGLLAWYHYRRDERVLAAVERAVQNTIANFPIGRSHPFYSKNANVGGLSHGLMFIDVLEDLYRITGKDEYRDYILFCYRDFSEQALNEDAQFLKLMDTSLMLNGHGVHTYEHLRAVAAATYVSGNDHLRVALNNFLKKIDKTITATGGPVGDEWIGGKGADATSRGYEYCSLHELLHSYAELFIKTGESQYGDRIEKLFFNAAQGARHPNGTCIAYLKSDNSYYMTGGLNGDSSVNHQTRYKYSPVHQDAAVCCVPNAGRIAPYYVQHMWMRSNDKIVAALLGPNVLKTSVGGEDVTIETVTAYPFKNNITFHVKAKGQSFELWVRKPGWVRTYSVSESYRDEDGFIKIGKRQWEGDNTIKIAFQPEVMTHRDINGEYYFTYGAMVLAHPKDAQEHKTKTHPIPGYFDFKYVPNDLVVYQCSGDTPVKEPGDDLVFRLEAIDPDNGARKSIGLVPVGRTILRQVTFKPVP